MLERNAVLIALALVFPGAALPQQRGERAAACGDFSSPVERERAWFADKGLSRRASGARLTLNSPRAISYSSNTIKVAFAQAESETAW